MSEAITHYAPDEPRARAIAMVDVGHSPEEVGPLVGVSGRTVRRWVERSREMSKGNKPIMERYTRNTLQAQDLIQAGLDVIEEDDSGALALKNLVPLNVIAGTGTDKLQKEHEQPAQTNIQAIIVVNSVPEVVEGEVVDVE